MSALEVSPFYVIALYKSIFAYLPTHSLTKSSYRESGSAVSRAVTSTRVRRVYSSSKLLEYSLLSISGCKFPFQFAVFLQSVDDRWNLWKLGASRFLLQLARVEMDLNIYLLVQGPNPVTLTHHRHHWHFVLKYFRY